MKVLITGGEGFIGRNLKEYLALDGSLEIFSPKLADLDLVSAESVSDYLRKVSIDVVIHSATTTPSGKEYPPNVCETNLRMFFNLVRCMNRSMRLINLGSGSEYSRSNWHPDMKESFFDAHVPEDSHSYSKYVVSKYIRDRKNLDMVTLRIFGVFGKYEDFRYKFISNAIAKNLTDLPIVINQNVVYDYLYIDDLCRLVKYFIFNSPRRRDYNLTPSDSIDLLGIAEIVNQVADRKSDVKLLNEGMGTTYTGNNDRLLKEIGGYSFTGYAESIENLYRYYGERRAQIDKKELLNDQFLEYARQLKKNYFR